MMGLEDLRTIILMGPTRENLVDPLAVQHLDIRLYISNLFVKKYITLNLSVLSFYQNIFTFIILLWKTSCRRAPFKFAMQ